MAEFEPNIIAFVCNWCTYAAADLAGTSRMQYPPNVKIIRLMCSGAVDPIYVIKPLLEGADGVFLGGCHPGDCHYTSGNYKARIHACAVVCSIAVWIVNPEITRQSRRAALAFEIIKLCRIRPVKAVF